MIDINELRRLAQAATPGPWHATKSVETNSWAVWSDTTRLMELRPAKTVDMYRVSNTAAFIAAANPAAITELFDRLEAAESDALEQARLNGMGGEREAALMAKLEAAEKERDALRAALRHEADCVEAAKAEIAALRVKVERMEKQGPVGQFIQHPSNGLWEQDGYGDNPDAKPLYALPVAQPAPSEQDASVRKAWARFSHELHRSPDAPYPGMADAFEQHFSQSFIDREWRAEAATWAAAWKAAKSHCGHPAPSVPECPYPCGWRNLLKHAIEDGAYLARSINEDEPVTENARAVTMRMVMRLRDVLMAINNAAPEAKP